MLYFSIDENRKPLNVLRYTKVFRSKSGTCTVKMDSKDTLFAYVLSKAKDTVFYTGEYYFKYTHLQLDSAQRKFYRLHKDSLRFVDGDNLPALPFLSALERVLFESKIKK